MMQSKIFFNGLHCSCHIRFIDLPSTSGSLYSSLSFFLPVIKHNVSSFTQLSPNIRCISTSDRKTASFRFSWAVTESCCPLLVITSAIFQPGFLITLQILSTFLSMRTPSLSGLSSPCSLMSNLDASGLNPSRIYLSCSHEAIISGLHALYTNRIPMYTSWCIILWWKIPSWGISIFAYSASGSTSFCSWATGSTSGSYPS